MKWTLSIRLVTLAFSCLFATACAKAKFGNSDSGVLASSSITTGTNTSTNPSTNTNTNNTSPNTSTSTSTATATPISNVSTDPSGLPSAPVSQIPQVTLNYSGNCVLGQICKVDINLGSPLSQPLTFQAHTDDNLYLSMPPAGTIYGIPNQDYQPTGWQIVIPAGQTNVQVQLQTLALAGRAPGEFVLMKLLFSACNLGGTQYSCASLGFK